MVLSFYYFVYGFFDFCQAIKINCSINVHWKKGRQTDRRTQENKNLTNSKTALTKSHWQTDRQ